MANEKCVSTITYTCTTHHTYVAKTSKNDPHATQLRVFSKLIVFNAFNTYIRNYSTYSNSIQTYNISEMLTNQIQHYHMPTVITHIPRLIITHSKHFSNHYEDHKKLQLHTHWDKMFDPQISLKPKDHFDIKPYNHGTFIFLLTTDFWKQ